MTKFRIVALTGFPALATVAACGSILDINDRELDDANEGGGVTPSTDGGGGTDAADSDIILEPAEASIPPLQGSKCDQQCGLSGGKCADRGAAGQICEFSCEGSCQINCPPGNDCTIQCAKDKNSCKDTTCVGGRSCTFLCKAKESCNAVSCQSDVCRFDCEAQSSCKNPKGFASIGCFIDCRGETTCNGDKTTSCLGTGSSQINCTGPGATCTGKPSCQPVAAQTCTISCGSKDSCPSYCCDKDAGGGECKFEGKIDGTKNCGK